MNQQRMMQIGAGLVALVVFALLWTDETPTATAPLPAPSSQVGMPSTPADVQAPAPGADAVPTPDGDFDYYVLVLSWSPTHCSSDQGRGRDDDLQCRSGRPYGFVLHGLWPQHERGYPQDCPTDEPRAVDDALLRQMLEISPSAQLVEHEWRKHGTCAGLSQADYFATAERAFHSISIPATYRSPTLVASTTPNDVRTAFLSANPTLVRDAVSATCRRNDLAEVWVCLDKTLRPRTCSKDVRDRHCGARNVRVRAVRGDWPR
jgi:ribonuclease T2